MRSMRVANLRASPYRFVCRIVARPQDGNGESIGSGVLISPHHVLTCAHVIYPLENPRTREILVCPGQDGANETGGRFTANGWAVSPMWRPGNCWTAGEDYGLIRLSKPTAQGFMALGRIDPARIMGTSVNLAGYPALTDKWARFMFESRGGFAGAARITRCSAGTLQGSTARPDANSQLLVHDIDSAKSQSGGPMWFDDPLLVAIHAGTIGGDRKKAIFLNDRVQQRLRTWMTGTLAPLRN
jgi:V8-like Glu-specific endopeptidase